MRLAPLALAPILLLSFSAPAVSAPALWKLGDADTTIYLFGTIHALPPKYRWKDARIAKALSSADTLVIETVIDKDPQAMARLFPPPDPTLPRLVDRVAPKHRKAFAAQLARTGLNISALDRMPTWQASFALMGAMMKDLGIDRASGVENSISDGFTDAAPVPGAAGGLRRVEGLETPASQLALFANLAETDQRELLESMVSGKGKAQVDYHRMLSAWSRGDERAIARAFAEDKDLTPHLREILLRQRNANWAQWLKARLDTPGVVFVAVGAGHLAGPMSVQHMLAEAGIRVVRVNAPAAAYSKGRVLHRSGGRKIAKLGTP